MFMKRRSDRRVGLTETSVGLDKVSRETKGTLRKTKDGGMYYILKYIIYF